jgi:hypothetical protein
MLIQLFKSNLKNKRYKVVFENGSVVHFGDDRYQNYTMHKDEGRKRLYIIRHEKNEDWTKSGIKTAGFWSKHLLWNLPSFTASIRDTERRFGIKIIDKTKSQKK